MRDAIALEIRFRGNPASPKVLRLDVGVVGEFASNNHGDVPAGGEELHDLGAFAGHFGPSGFGLGILFEGAIGHAIEFEIDLGEPALGGAADGIECTGESDSFGAVNKSLAPDREEGVVQAGDAFTGGHETNHSARNCKEQSFAEKVGGYLRSCS